MSPLYRSRSCGSGMYSATRCMDELMEEGIEFGTNLEGFPMIRLPLWKGQTGLGMVFHGSLSNSFNLGHYSKSLFSRVLLSLKRVMWCSLLIPGIVGMEIALEKIPVVHELVRFQHSCSDIGDGIGFLFEIEDCGSIPDKGHACQSSKKKKHDRVQILCALLPDTTNTPSQTDPDGRAMLHKQP